MQNICLKIDPYLDREDYLSSFTSAKLGWISNSLENDRNLHEVIDCLWQVHSVKYKLDTCTLKASIIASSGQNQALHSLIWPVAHQMCAICMIDANCWLESLKIDKNLKLINDLARMHCFNQELHSYSFSNELNMQSVKNHFQVWKAAVACFEWPRHSTKVCDWIDDGFSQKL